MCKLEGTALAQITTRQLVAAPHIGGLAKKPMQSVLVAEHFYVFGAFLDWSAAATLYLYADLLDDIGVGERGDVASIHLIGNGSSTQRMILPERVFGMSGTM